MADEFIIPPAGQPVIKEFSTQGDTVRTNKAKLIISAAGLSLVKPLLYSIPRAEKAIEKKEDFAVNNTEVERANGLRAQFAEQGGSFGLPVFDTLTFSGSGSINDTLEYVTFEGERILLDPLRMDIVLLTVTQVKNIVRTPISGRNGTVKEYISDGDYKIEAKGMFFGDYTDVEDTKNKKALIDYSKANISINCSSNFLQDFGINSLVIEKLIISQVEGERNRTMYDMTCFSDTPFEIQSTQDAETP